MESCGLSLLCVQMEQGGHRNARQRGLQNGKGLWLQCCLYLPRGLGGGGVTVSAHSIKNCILFPNHNTSFNRQKNYVPGIPWGIQKAFLTSSKISSFILNYTYINLKLILVVLFNYRLTNDFSKLYKIIKNA